MSIQGASLCHIPGEGRSPLKISFVYKRFTEKLITRKNMSNFDEIPNKKPKLEDLDENDEVVKPGSKKIPISCPYLDRINRSILDFDFEKLCSVSLTRINVYACLVCGKYFQGRGTNTHAYTHSVSESHHVFLNLLNLRFYCLPDNYEIVDSSLDVSSLDLRINFSALQFSPFSGHQVRFESNFH